MKAVTVPGHYDPFVADVLCALTSMIPRPGRPGILQKRTPGSDPQHLYVAPHERSRPPRRLQPSPTLADGPAVGNVRRVHAKPASNRVPKSRRLALTRRALPFPNQKGGRRP